jgi:hypothetical protein
MKSTEAFKSSPSSFSQFIGPAPEVISYKARTLRIYKPSRVNRLDVDLGDRLVTVALVWVGVIGMVILLSFILAK